MKRWITFLTFIWIAGCTTGTQDINLNNPNDPNGSSGLVAPQNLRALVGDGQVTITWEMPASEGDTARAFAVYRRQLTPEDSKGYKRITEVQEETATDRTVRNGRVYGYQIAAGREPGGPYGKRSEEIEVAPALFSLVIENGARVTNSQSGSVVFNAPQNTASFKMSETADLTDAPYQRFTGSSRWDFSPGDGSKTLFALFRFSDGSESEIVSDSIDLDTHAYINRVDFQGGEVREPGEMVHFSLEANEVAGDARVTVAAVFTNVDLFDDGTHGDAVPDDGLYEGEATIPAGKRADQSAVEGRFTDQAGNTATVVEASKTLSVAEAPIGVVLSPPLYSEPPDVPAVTLRWTQSQIRDFNTYQLYRSETSAVDSTDLVAATTSNRSTVELTDGDIEEGKTYSYRVYVRNSIGMLTGSNRVQALVPNVRPPAAVDLGSTDGITETSIGLRWTAGSDRDLDGYALYRSTDTYVDDTGELIATLTDPLTELYTDSNLVENTDYTYRLYALDTGGLTTPGAQLTATTANAAPLAVTLGAGADVDTSAVTLSWSPSDAHDFQSYRLYRDLGPGVGTFSTLVVEIEDQDVLEFRDVNLDPETPYYFRLYVFDDGTIPGPESAGSNTVSIKTDSTN